MRDQDSPSQPATQAPQAHDELRQNYRYLARSPGAADDCHHSLSHNDPRPQHVHRVLMRH